MKFFSLSRRLAVKRKKLNYSHNLKRNITKTTSYTRLGGVIKNAWYASVGAAAVFALLLGSGIATLPFGTASAYTFKGNNDQNRLNDNSHVNFVKATTTSVTLEFVNPDNFSMCFEYRTDGDTSQVIGTNPPGYPLPERYPYLCLANSTEERTFTPNQYVEVRSAFGAESDYFFDWLRFDVVDTSSTQFVNDPKYVRANNGGDLTAQVVTPDTTEDVRFFLNGDSSTFFPGSNIGGAGATTSWWRLYTPLAAGQHTVHAQVKIHGDWHDVADTGLVYSLDKPWAEYVIPQADKSFRPNDEVVRVKADDEFDQFKQMVVMIGGTEHTVLRANCEDKGPYVLCGLKNLGLTEGSYFADTTTYTKANNRVDDLLSEPFYIDGTAPQVLHLEIENDVAGYVSSPIKAAAEASDNHELESVNFYLTLPRLNDGACTGNGTKIVSFRQNTPSPDGKYRADLAVPGLNGEYCVTAVARDSAFNNSALVHQKVILDTSVTKPQLVTPSNNAVVNGASITQSWDTPDTDIDYYIYESYHDAAATVLRWHETFSAKSKTATNVAETTYWWRVKAVDKVGNVSEWSDLWKITVDNTAPLAEITAPSNNTVVKGIIDIRGSVTDNNPLRYHVQIENESGGVVYSKTTNKNTAFTNELLHSWDTTKVADGTYKIYLEARDKADNKAGSRSFPGDSVAVVTVTVDNTAPAQVAGLRIRKGHSASAPLLGCDGHTNSTKIRIEWNASPESDVAYYWFGTKFNAKHKKVNAPTTAYNDNMTPGNNPYYYTVIAVDHAGNESPISEQCGIELDQESPLVNISAPEDGAEVSGEVSVLGEVTDNLALSHYNLSLYPGDVDLSDGDTHSGERINDIVGWDDGTETVTGTTADVNRLLDTTLLSNGEYQIRLAARDAAENRDTSDVTGNFTASVHVIKFMVNNQAEQSPNGVQGVSTDGSGGDNSEQKPPTTTFETPSIDGDTGQQTTNFAMNTQSGNTPPEASEQKIIQQSLGSVTERNSGDQKQVPQDSSKFASTNSGFNLSWWWLLVPFTLFAFLASYGLFGGKAE